MCLCCIILIYLSVSFCKHMMYGFVWSSLYCKRHLCSLTFNRFNLLNDLYFYELSIIMHARFDQISCKGLTLGTIPTNSCMNDVIAVVGVGEKRSWMLMSTVKWVILHGKLHVKIIILYIGSRLKTHPLGHWWLFGKYSAPTGDLMTSCMYMFEISWFVKFY